MKDFIFIHIPKNAGQSIKKALNLPTSVCTPASKHLERMGEAKYNSKFSFTFVRNSWDRQVSFYHFIRKTPTHYLYELVKESSFHKYITQILPMWEMLFESQLEYIDSKNGKLLIDFVGCFEKLEHDFREVCNHIGIKTTLPKINTTEHKPYQQYYNEKTKRIVGETFEKDIQSFGFKF